MASTVFQDFNPHIPIVAAWLNDVNQLTYNQTQSGVGATPRTAASKLLEIVSVEDFLPTGYVTDGSVDYSTQLQNAFNAINLVGGGVVSCRIKLYIASSVIIGPNTTFSGPTESLGSSRGNYSNEYSLPPSLRLSNTATLTLSKGSTIRNWLIINNNLLPQLPLASAASATTAIAAYAGTAISGSNVEDTYVHNCRILGFAQAISTTLCDRVKVEWVDVDCTAGLLFDSTYDVSRISNVHCWPFVTYGYSFSLSPGVWIRAGSAFKTTTEFDACVMLNCFAYGYAIGFDIGAPLQTQLIGCFADSNAAGANSGQIGFKVSGASTAQIIMSECGASAMDTGVMTSGAGLTINIVNCNFWGNRVHIQAGTSVYAGVTNCQFRYLNSSWIPDYQIHVNNVGGVIDISGCLFYGSNTYNALYVENYGNSIKIHGNTFETSLTGITFAATMVGEAAVIGNSFPATTTPYNFTALTGTALRSLTLIGNTGMASDSIGEQHIVKYGQPNSSNYSYGGANGPRHYNYYATGTVSAPGLVAPSATLASFRSYGYDGVVFQAAGLTRFSADGTPAAGSMPGIFIVSTTPAGTVSPIDRNGTDNGGNFRPVTDNAYTLGASGFRWSAVWSANGTIQTSDARVKTDITNSTLGLSFINTLRPVSYKWIEGSVKVLGQDEGLDGEIGEVRIEAIAGTRTHWGLIAQEVKAAVDAAGVDFGGWVLSDSADPTSQQALRYDQFVSPLIKAIQELSVRVLALEAKAGL